MPAAGTEATGSRQDLQGPLSHSMLPDSLPGPHKADQNQAPGPSPDPEHPHLLGRSWSIGTAQRLSEAPSDPRTRGKDGSKRSEGRPAPGAHTAASQRPKQAESEEGMAMAPMWPQGHCNGCEDVCKGVGAQERPCKTISEKRRGLRWAKNEAKLRR